MSVGEHHLHKRARSGKPGKRGHSRLIRVLDRVMCVVAILSPVALLPQVLELYQHHNADGLSITTWTLLGVFNLLWLTYGLLHKATPVFVSSALLATLNFAIVWGIILYR